MSNLLKNTNLIKEYDFDKNKDIDINQLPCGSHKRVWWVCAKGHHWQATVKDRSNGSGCPYCSNKKVLTGFNDLATKNPELAKEWDTEKNVPLKSDEVTAYSNKKVWWVCDKGHHWAATVAHRSNGEDCPYCSNKKALTGFNDLATKNPKLAKEWDTERNKRGPECFLVGSYKKVWWVCANGHHWAAAVKDRNNGSGCPYCSNRKILKGFNDLATKNPKLAKEWDTKRNKKGPECFLAGSHKKVWWVCANGHHWAATVVHRSNGEDCPYCSNRKILKGFNDLATKNPELTKEWDPERNKKGPECFLAGSHKKVWWVCTKGHHWQAIIHNRVNRGSGCPKCDIERKTSFCEQAIFYYVKQNFPDAINSDHQHIGMELDIYVPSKRLGIEYDGVYWHKGKRKNKLDSRKNKLCNQKNIKLIRIREKGLNKIPGCINLFRKENSKNDSLDAVIIQLLNHIGVNKKDINTNRDNSKILAQYTQEKNEKSLAYKYPDVSKTWNYKKNYPLTPDQVSAFSSQEVWWRCSKGHEYKRRISKHSLCGGQCPICYKMKHNHKIRCIETGKIFDSAEQAARFYNLTSGEQISKCCHGRAHTSAGHHWEWV